MSDFERISTSAPEDVPPALEPDASTAQGLPEETSESWAARLKSLDFVREHRTAIIAVGAAAVAVGVGAYALSKRGDGGKFFIDFADRRAREQGVISLGEIAEGGAAVSLPVSEAALEGLEATKSTGTTMKALFAMTGRTPSGETGDFAYPLSGDQEQVRKHGETARRAASWLLEHLSRRSGEAS